MPSLSLPEGGDFTLSQASVHTGAHTAHTLVHKLQEETSLSLTLVHTLVHTLLTLVHTLVQEETSLSLTLVHTLVHTLLTLVHTLVQEETSLSLTLVHTLVHTLLTLVHTLVQEETSLSLTLVHTLLKLVHTLVHTLLTLVHTLVHKLQEETSYTSAHSGAGGHFTVSDTSAHSGAHTAHTSAHTNIGGIPDYLSSSSFQISRKKNKQSSPFPSPSRLTRSPMLKAQKRLRTGTEGRMLHAKAPIELPVPTYQHRCHATVLNLSDFVPNSDESQSQHDLQCEMNVDVAHRVALYTAVV